MKSDVLIINQLVQCLVHPKWSLSHILSMICNSFFKCWPQSLRIRLQPLQYITHVAWNFTCCSSAANHSEQSPSRNIQLLLPQKLDDNTNTVEYSSSEVLTPIKAIRSVSPSFLYRQKQGRYPDFKNRRLKNEDQQSAGHKATMNHHKVSTKKWPFHPSHLPSWYAPLLVLLLLSHIFR